MARPLVAAGVVLAMLLGAASAGAQDLPELEPGVAVYVPIVEGIVVDGDLRDWASVDSITTATGPQPPADPANTGSVTWQVAANSESLVFNAVVVDATIVAGQHGTDYWNEDSVELYVNFTSDLAATSYVPGIAQITISPIDIGNSDPTSLTITGTNSAELGVRGFVFATSDGWGIEVEVPFPTSFVPSDDATFGLQVQANGSSGGDRDTKLSWSLADISDQSFADPSLFGTGRIVVQQAQAVIEDPPEVVDDTSDDIVDTPDMVLDEEPVIAEAPVAAPAETAVEPSTGNRALLVAAVLSAIAVLAGGFWFEHRRKRAEEQAAQAKMVAAAAESEPLELESGVS